MMEAQQGASNASAATRPVRWRALFLCALVLLPLLAACTGSDIGGSGSGWNALVSEGGRVYVGTKQGEVKEFIDNGFEGVRPGWTFPPPGNSINLEGVYHPPLVVGGLVYVAAQNGVLYALDRETGQDSNRGWWRPQGVPQNLPPLVGAPAYDPINELVVIGSEDGRLYGYDADTGDPVWTPFLAGDKIWSSPVIKEGVAYFGSHDKKVYAVSLATGKEIWQSETGGVVAGKPLLFDNMVIAGSFDKKLYAFNITNGEPLWEFEGKNWFWAGAVTDGSTIFAPSMDGNIYALSRDGQLLWKHDVGSSIVSSPVLVPRGLVVTGKESRLALLDVGPGNIGLQRELSSLALGDGETKAPLYANGESVFVGSQDGTIRRIEIKGGQVQMWCVHTRDFQCN